MDLVQQRLQRLLDTQGQGLEQQDDRTTASARAGILQAMKQLVQMHQQAIAEHTQESQSLGTWIESQDESRSQAADLEKNIRQLEDSELGDYVRSIESEVASVDSKIRDLEAQLSQMRQNRSTLMGQLDQAQSKLESRCSKFRLELSELQHHVIASDKEYEIRKQKMLAHEEKIEQYTKERSALADGSVLWLDCINILDELRQKLQNLSASGGGAESWQSRDELVKKYLSDTISRLQVHLDFVQSKNWELLKVAIGQEVVTLQQALDMVQNAANASE